MHIGTFEWQLEHVCVLIERRKERGEGEGGEAGRGEGRGEGGEGDKEHTQSSFQH